ncbi:hypothetical protein CFR75_14500 [Komagataeibacter xylinus]|uniref:2-dehydropantoate 2-reductase n=2 Tax=Komagataeibacter TaxID=1434011 RepID=A0A318QN07_9PROT|nr:MULTISPECIES: 2-dehydropantoate 2-reductase N-terminal domain-containing protein [Komagataeibacter]AZV40643.1 hypothetical protein CXP35_17325 [Komagataeibacter xylinus]PYD55792.1 hypothetical protein CFR75_14500 [Komagataeibacter xylinus]PYD78731.1 hypothetical protein CFR80_16040 [Komagataeibacter oboediens]GBQ75308.1 hypothetical protein AA15237_2059 [Komagataeibacter xylinus NBRC 15237]
MGSRILVVGPGAVGGYFGARMASAGHDVTFLVRERRLQQLRAGGLCLISSVGNVTMTPRMVMAGGIEGPYDIILLSVKAYSLTSSMFRDLLQGAPVEAQQIIGDLVRRARVHQIPTPLLDLTDLNLRVYEQQRHA